MLHAKCQLAHGVKVTWGRSADVDLVKRASANAEMAGGFSWEAREEQALGAMPGR